jgi:peptidoglycan/LPS O-acetylase OafA/YrhL
LAWSISVEVFLYFCYVAVCRPLGRLTSTRSILVAISALVVVSTIGFGVVLLRIQAWQDWDWSFYISPYCRIPEFFLGALTAALFQKVPKANVTLLGCASLAWVLTFLFGPAIFPRNIGDLYHLCWMFAPGVAGLIYTLAVKRHAFFENKGVLVLGEASYSMYLLQPYVIASVLLAGGDMTNVWVVVSKCALIFVWLSATSIASFTCLEVPARRFIRSMLNPDRRLRYDAVSVPTFPEPAG